MEHNQVEVAVATAIKDDLDLVEACPWLMEMKIEHLEAAVSQKVETFQKEITTCIEGKGKEAIEADDAEGLRGILLRGGVQVPPQMLLKMCEKIISQMKITTRLICNFPDFSKPMVPAFTTTKGEVVKGYKNGSVWYVKMTINYP